MNLFFRIRVWWKLLKRRFFVVNSFCKLCGVAVRDFNAPDDVWKQIEPHIKQGNVLCYQCFCDLCEVVGIETAWSLYQPMKVRVSRGWLAEPGNLPDISEGAYAGLHYESYRGSEEQADLDSAADDLHAAAVGYLSGGGWPSERLRRVDSGEDTPEEFVAHSRRFEEHMTQKIGSMGINEWLEHHATEAKKRGFD